MRSLPVESIRGIHIAGGSDVTSADGRQRVLDDHRHGVPESVYALLERIGKRVPHGVDAILERDGTFPACDDLRLELDRARAALAAGRATRQVDLRRRPADGSALAGFGAGDQRAPAHGRADQAQFEGFLARLYTDRALREEVFANPEAPARRCGLAVRAIEALRSMDRSGVELAAWSLEGKRLARERPDRATWVATRTWRAHAASGSRGRARSGRSTPGHTGRAIVQLLANVDADDGCPLYGAIDEQAVLLPVRRLAAPNGAGVELTTFAGRAAACARRRGTRASRSTWAPNSCRRSRRIHPVRP